MRATVSPWRLIRSGGPIDASQLLAAICAAATSPDADTRTQLLVRDSLKALEDHWGSAGLRERLAQYPASSSILRSAGGHPQERGFSNIGGRIVDATDPNVFLQMLREMGTRLSTPASIVIGGSIALMMDGLITRTTDDADVVNEVPSSLRAEPALLDELKQRYGLALTHFQSHFLPSGWEKRVQSIGQFGNIAASKVDSIDILIGKLFSRRAKDLDDVRQAWLRMDQKTFRSRLGRDTSSFRADPGLRAAAEANWYIVTGETTLP
jgi:hypothetical protein